MSLLQYALWLRDNAVDRIRRALLGVLKAGPIPHHVAFIMDGNRRYARDKGVKVLQGHVDGFVALRRVRAQPMHDHPCPPPKKKQFCKLSIVTDIGDMLRPRHQGRFCIRLCDRQLQAPRRGGGWAHGLSRKSTPGTLLARVRRHIRSPRSGVENLAPQGCPR